MLSAALAREAESAKLPDITSIFADTQNPKSIFAISNDKNRTYTPVDVENLKPLNDFIAKPQTVPQQDTILKQESKCVIF